MFDSILVVCTGNICRSPIGEQLLRQLLPGKQITSAGIFGLEGSPADIHAQDVARRHGLSLGEHRARKLTPQIMRESDLILVMELTILLKYREVQVGSMNSFTIHGITNLKI